MCSKISIAKNTNDINNEKPLNNESKTQSKPIQRHEERIPMGRDGFKEHYVMQTRTQNHI